MKPHCRNVYIRFSENNNVITNKYTQQDEPMASAGDAKETIYNKKNNSLSGTRRLLCGIGNQTHHISAEAPWPRWDFLERTNAMSDDELGYDGMRRSDRSPNYTLHSSKNFS